VYASELDPYHTPPVHRGVGSREPDMPSDFVETAAGRIPRAQYVQWQALAEAAAAAQQRGGSSEGASAGMALNMELLQTCSGSSTQHSATAPLPWVLRLDWIARHLSGVEVVVLAGRFGS